MEPSRGSTGGRFVSALIAALLFLGIALIGYSSIQYGVDITQEGFYASAAQRLALGDTPISDDYSLAGRSFDLLLWPAFLLPDTPLLHLRLLGLGLQLALVLLLFALLARFAPAYLVAASLVAVALVNGDGIWLPGYIAIGLNAGFAAFICWLFACLSTGYGRFFWPLPAAICACVATVACLPLAIIFVVPLLTAVAALFHPVRRQRLFVPSLFFCLLFALALGGVAFFLYRMLMVDDWLAAMYRAGGQWTASVWQARAAAAARDAGAIAPFILAVAGLVLGMGLLPPKRRGFLAAVTGLLIVAAGTALLWWIGETISFDARQVADKRPLYCLLAGAVGVVGAALAARPRGMSASDPYWDGWGLVQWSLVASGLIALSVMAVLASSGMVAAGLCALVLFPVGVVGLSRHLFSPHLAPEGSMAQRVLPRMATLAICAVFSVIYVSRIAEGQFDAPEQAVAEGMLRGIRVPTEQARILDHIVSELRSRGLEPGDYLLAYDDCPGIYYLTQTRPAVPFTWLRQMDSPHLRKDAVELMMHKGRVPEFCVRILQDPRTWGTDAEGPPTKFTYSGDPSDPCYHPIDAYVAEHYGRVVATPVFEIWQRRDVGITAIQAVAPAGSTP